MSDFDYEVYQAHFDTTSGEGAMYTGSRPEYVLFFTQEDYPIQNLGMDSYPLQNSDAHANVH